MQIAEFQDSSPPSSKNNGHIRRASGERTDGAHTSVSEAPIPAGARQILHQRGALFMLDHDAAKAPLMHYCQTLAKSP